MTGDDGLLALLAGVPLFAGLDGEAKARLAAEALWFSLPGGAVLFAEGDPGDALYVVLRGSLVVVRRTADGGRRRLARVQAGETVGEMGLITGRDRSATAIAERDCEILHLSKAVFETLVMAYPAAMLGMTRQIVRRFEATQAEPVAGPRPRSFALLPIGPVPSLDLLCRHLAEALSAHGRTRVVEAAEAADETTDWFHRVETAHDYVLYRGDDSGSPWSQLCLRQADMLLLVAAAAEGDPRRRHPLEELAGLRHLPTDLVLLQPAGIVLPNDTGHWLGGRPLDQHHHLRLGKPADAARLARHLARRATGLVLSGGGARGFAHLGAARALGEAGIALDQIGGCSIGAVIGAGLAAQWDLEALAERLRAAFVKTNPVNDLTLPLVALTGGHKVSRLLRQAFGELRIEDLWLPFYCVSTNLSTGLLSVHRRGLLWQWLRASVAIPGIMPPWVGNGELHADGGVLDNLPVGPMRRSGRGPVVAVDVGEAMAFSNPDPLPYRNWLDRLIFPGRSHMPNIFQILLRAGTLKSAEGMPPDHGADLYLVPPVEGVDFLDWPAFDRAVALGYAFTCRELAKDGRAAALAGRRA